MYKPRRTSKGGIAHQHHRRHFGLQFSLLTALCLGIFLRFTELGAITGEVVLEVADRYSAGGSIGRDLIDGSGDSSVARPTMLGYVRSGDSLSLYPGEMPGYTGHTRPQGTLAGHFYLVDEFGDHLEDPTSLLVTDASKPWSARVKCFSCGDVNPQFYMRAYGPTVHAGRVYHERSPDGSSRMWRLELPPLVDAGMYFVEAILAFSHVPPISKYPHEDGAAGEPVYEGYALANFPMIINVLDNGDDDAYADNMLNNNEQQRMLRGASENDDDDDDETIIALQDMMVKDLNCSNDEFGRWKVIERNTLVPKDKAVRTMEFDGYKDGTNSIGVKFQYLPRRKGKELVSKPEHYQKLKGLLDASDKYYSIISLGDSNIRLMNDDLGRKRNEQDLQTFLHYRLPTNGGLQVTMPEIKQRLYDEILNPKFDNIFVVNAGMHEINENCAFNNMEERKARGVDDATFQCIEQYRKDLGAFLDMLLEVPNTRRIIFQTTTAAWPKHGNYGFAWPAADPTYGPQYYTKSSNFVEAFNKEALSVIFNNERYRDAIDVIDGYWCTLSRPDSREVETHAQVLTNHLVHGGTEIYKLFTSEYLTILYNVAKEDVATMKERGVTGKKSFAKPRTSSNPAETDGSAPEEQTEKKKIGTAPVSEQQQPENLMAGPAKGAKPDTQKGLGVPSQTNANGEAPPSIRETERVIKDSEGTERKEPTSSLSKAGNSQ